MKIPKLLKDEIQLGTTIIMNEFLESINKYYENK